MHEEQEVTGSGQYSTIKKHHCGKPGRTPARRAKGVPRGNSYVSSQKQNEQDWWKTAAQF